MLIIDGDHLLVYRIGFAIEKDKHGMDSGKYNISSFLDKLINKTLDFDRKIYLTGKDNFRNSIATILPYKGNRLGAKKPKYYNQIRDYLVDYYDAIIIDGMEADDAMGIEQMKNYHESEDEGDTGYCDSIIVACDKDMDMIPGRHYNPMKDKEYWISDLEGHRNFYTQCLTGDSTDNIPGLKGMGPVGAKKILGHLSTIDGMEAAVGYAYSAAMKAQENNVYKIELKGNTTYTREHSDYVEILNEIKQLLWIRRK